MIYVEVAPGLFRISLVQKMVGFRDFVSCWLYIGHDITFVVDPGPLFTVDRLIEALSEIGVSQLDYILLTHIHIDHAGGAGRLLARFPSAEVICHPKGIPHMVDPTNLWQGSLKVLGPIAEAYGEIIPIPEKKIRFSESIQHKKTVIQVIDTPGHAPHHQCYLMNGILFAGEVAGISYEFNKGIYRRPATPPRFKLEISLASLDKVLAAKPDAICYGHFGYRTDTQNALRTARFQLILWTDIVMAQLEEGEENLYQRVKEDLLEKDPVFAVYRELDPDMKKREDDFINNAITGMKEYALSQRQIST